MSNEAMFKQDLNELRSALEALQGDIETGPVDKINDWYDQVLELLFTFEDDAEDVIGARTGYDGESLDDEDVVEDGEEEEITMDETDEESGDETEGEDVEADTDIETEEEISSDSAKTVIVTVKLKA